MTDVIINNNESAATDKTYIPALFGVTRWVVLHMYLAYGSELARGQATLQTNLGYVIRERVHVAT